MLAYHYSKGEDLEKAEEYMTRAGEEALRSSASSEALNYFKQALKLYVDRYGEKADPKKLTSFKKNLALAHFNRGHFSEALAYFDEILASKGYRPTKGKLASAMKAIADLLAITTFLYFPIQRGTRVPDPRESEDIDLIYMRGWCLLPIDSRRFLIECFSLVRIALGFDLHRMPQGPEWASVVPVPFIHLGLYSLSTKLLKRAEGIARDQNHRGAIEFAMTDSFLHLSAGTWDSVPALDPSLVDLGLRVGKPLPCGALCPSCGDAES